MKQSSPLCFLCLGKPVSPAKAECHSDFEPKVARLFLCACCNKDHNRVCGDNAGELDTLMWAVTRARHFERIRNKKAK